MSMPWLYVLFVLASLSVAHGLVDHSRKTQQGSLLRGRRSSTEGGFSLRSSKLTAEEQKAVVDKHNQLRALHNKTHQPCTAADMEAMVWDDTLAEEAQAYADGCVGDHADGAGSKFGENLFIQFPQTDHTTKDLTGGVQAWYDEIVDTVWDIKDRKVTSKPRDQCKEVSGDACNVGHYFQVIWAKSSKVGCGIAACTSSFMVSGSNYGTGVLMVCRYQKAASLGAGQTNSLPYIFGKPCAACPDHCSNGLCTAPPTRCLDKLGGDNGITIGSNKFTSCKELVKAHPEGSQMPWCSMLAGMMKAEDTCALSCGKCTVPSGVGVEYCDGAAKIKDGGDEGPPKKDKEEGPPKKDKEEAPPKKEKAPDGKQTDAKGDHTETPGDQGGDADKGAGGKSNGSDEHHDEDSWGWDDDEDEDSWGWEDDEGDEEDWDNEDPWSWENEGHEDGEVEGDASGEMEGEDEGWFELKQKKVPPNANGE